MKQIEIGSPTTITLEQSGLTTGKDIFLSIIGDNGKLLTDSSGDEIKDIQLLFNATTSKYYATLTINQTTPEQYVRLFFKSSDVVISEEFAPEDAILKLPLAVAQEVVPVQFFIDYILNVQYSYDPIFKSILVDYIRTNRNGIRAYLTAATSELEMITKKYFWEREVTTVRDYFYEEFRNEYWQKQLDYTPVNSLTEVKLLYNKAEVAIAPTEYFMADRKTGVVEFLPSPDGVTSNLYTTLLTRISAFSNGILNNSMYGRIPNFFHFTYKTGLIYDGCDNAEKEAIRMAVCKRAFLSIINLLDGSGKVGSVSESMDGTSSSISYNVGDLVKRLAEEEKAFITMIDKRYGSSISMVVI